MKYNQFTRRMFLRGSGSFMLSIPLLPSLLPRAEAQAAGQAVRYVQFISNHGVVARNFWPATTYAPNRTFAVNGTALPDMRWRPLSEISGPISTMLGTDFDQFRNKMNLIRGLHSTEASMFHNATYPTTGAPPVSDEGPASFPYSVDFVLEKSSKFYTTQAKVPALRLTPGVDSSYKWGSYCWGVNASGSRVRLSAYNATATALSAVFGSSTGGQVDATIALRSQVADLVKDDYKRIIASNRASAADKQQLNNYMDLVNDAQKRMMATSGATCTAPSQMSQSDFDVLHQNAADIAAAALLCGATKIVAYHAYQGSPTSYDEESFHAWTHDDANKATTMQSYREKQFARLLRRLDSLTESNGQTLLDNSLVFHSNEFADGAGHSQNDMPVIIAGSAGGKLTTGNYINYVNRPYNSVLVTIFNALGLTAPADYEKAGVIGFGSYTGGNSRVSSMYLTDVEKRKPLPMLISG